MLTTIDRFHSTTRPTEVGVIQKMYMGVRMYSSVVAFELDSRSRSSMTKDVSAA